MAIHAGLACAIGLVLWSPVQARCAEPAAGKTMMQEKMAEHCQTMKIQKQKMKDDMRVHDAQLTEQIATMNRAPQDKKTDLMAAVITRMVEHRIAMDARKSKMEEEMMQHMMEHMQMGGESMSKCPMMQAMKDKHDQSAGKHDKHRDEAK